MPQQERSYIEKVKFEVWRNGGDPDIVTTRRITEAFFADEDFSDFARKELKRQHNIRSHGVKV